MKKQLSLLAALGLMAVMAGCGGGGGDDGPPAYLHESPTVVSFSGLWRLTDLRSPSDRWVLELTETDSGNMKQVSGVMYREGDPRRFTLGPGYIVWLPSESGGHWDGTIRAEDNGTYRLSLWVEYIAGDEMNGTYAGSTENRWTAVRE